MSLSNAAISLVRVVVFQSTNACSWRFLRASKPGRLKIAKMLVIPPSSPYPLGRARVRRLIFRTRNRQYSAGSNFEIECA